MRSFMAENASIPQPLSPASVGGQGSSQTGINLHPGDLFRTATYVILSLAAIIYVLPFVWMAAKSVMTLFEANSTAIIPSQFHLENYQQALVDSNFAVFFWNSVRITF